MRVNDVFLGKIAFDWSIIQYNYCNLCILLMNGVKKYIFAANCNMVNTPSKY